MAVDAPLDAHEQPMALVGAGGRLHEREPGPAAIVPAGLDHGRQHSWSLLRQKAALGLPGAVWLF